MNIIVTVTIKDVAKAAGVSISTVSNALNGVEVLHPDTKAHIIEVANQLNYIPNLNGRNLKANQTKVIGLFITSIQGPYYGTLADAIFKECDKNGYELNIYISHDYKTAFSNILGKRVDGAIISHEWMKDEQIKVIEEANIPVVFLDREKKGNTVASILFDSYHGGVTIADYLLKLGHKRLGYIHGYMNTYDDAERYRGFRDTIKKANLEIPEDCIITGYFEEEATFAVVNELIKKNIQLPEGFFAANDVSAIGCIKALQDNGFSVPEDISVVGFDDIDLCQYFSPRLTTMNNPIKKQGSMAVVAIIEMIQKKSYGRIEKLEGRLVTRDSCRQIGDIV